jgi:hypothetical protein
MSGRQYFERNGLIWGSNLPSTQRFVLLALNEHADQYGESCYPGQQTLADLTGYNRRTISRALEGLKEQGVVSWITNGRTTATKATNDYKIDFETLATLMRSKPKRIKPCDHLSQGVETDTPCDPLSSDLRAEDHKAMGQTITRSTHRSDQGSAHKTPLTPQGGNGAIASENFQDSERADQTDDQQTPLSGQQAKKSGSKSKGGSSRATKNQTSEQILAMLPEAMQARFRKFWKGYSRFCTERNAKTGPIKRAVVAWKFLVDGDFNGKGLSGFDEGVRVFLKQQGDRTAGIPHASKFLFSTINGSGAWEDALEQAASQGSLSDLTGTTSSDRGHSPPVRTAEDFAFPEASKPPAFIKEQIRQMKGAAACA